MNTARNRSFSAPRRIAVSFLLLLVFGGGPLVAADPVLTIPDLDAFFDVQSTDCPTCTQTELDELGQGLRLLLTKLREGTTNPDGRVCRPEAGLTRELAVLTYDLVRQGHISVGRWRDYIRSRGAISGLSEAVADEMLTAYLGHLEGAADGVISPNSLEERQIRIHGAAQLSRLFFQMATGEWSRPVWMDVLAGTEGGINPVVDAVLGSTGPGRIQLDQALVDWKPYRAWTDGQLAHQSYLPDDFLVGSIPADRDALWQGYQAAMEDQPWTTFFFLEGDCGWEVFYAWREEARRASEGLGVNPSADKRNTGDEDADSFGGGFLGIFLFLFYLDEGTTVIGEMPPPVNPGTTRPGGLGGIPGNQGGGEGATNQGGGQEPPPFCDDPINRRIFAGECVRNLSCSLNPSIQQQNFRNCQEEQPIFDEGDANCIFRVPGDPGPCTVILDLFCHVSGGTCAAACARYARQPLRALSCTTSCEQGRQACLRLPRRVIDW